MSARVVHRLPGEGFFATAVKDIQDHSTDDEYVVRFIGSAATARDDFVLRCHNFPEVSKYPKDIYAHIGEAFRQAFGADARIYTPYTLQKVLRDEEHEICE